MEKTIRMLEKGGYCIANGYGPLKDKTFRIGHMGDITIEDTRNMLYQLERLLTINEELKVFASKTI
jgi:aspartate aminotransferase-like enzyme